MCDFDKLQKETNKVLCSNLKRLSIIILYIFIFLPIIAQNQPHRVIHLVYDDSGSMILNERISGIYYERWAYARYAMEVFAAKLEDNDIMRIYYMEDFLPREGRDFVRHTNLTQISGNDVIDIRTYNFLEHLRKTITDTGESSTIRGTQDRLSRVQTVHNKVTYSIATPFDPVLRAYVDLSNQSADQKWLIVFTDGEFNRIDNTWFNETEFQINTARFYSDFKHHDNDIKIVHFAMGSEAAMINQDIERHIYAHHARNDNDILREVINVTNRVFNRNSLPFNNVSARTFNFDVPLKNLIIFAQSNTVRINSVSNLAGDVVISPIGFQTNVGYNPRYFPNDGRERQPRLQESNRRNIKFPTLSGIIAWFPAIPEGEYVLNIDGAEGVQVDIYYTPDVNLDFRIDKRKNSKWIELTDKELSKSLPQDTYRIRYGLVPAGKESEIIQDFRSELLGVPTYKVTKDTLDIDVASGDILELNLGEYDLIFLASFLDVNFIEEVVPLNIRKKHVGDWVSKHSNWFKVLTVILLLIIALRVYKYLYGNNKKFPDSFYNNPKRKKYGKDFEIKVDNKNKYGGKFMPIYKTYGKMLTNEEGYITITVGKVFTDLHVMATGKNRMKIINYPDYLRADGTNKTREIGVDNFFIIIDGSNKTIRDIKDNDIDCNSVFQIVYNDGNNTQRCRVY